MDPRIREHAAVIVEHATSVERGDNVLVRGPPPAEDLVVAVNELCGERGAITSASLTTMRARRAHLRAIDEDDVALNEMVAAKYDAADVIVTIGGSENVNESSDIPPETNQKSAAANQPLQEKQLEKRWLYTQYPAPGNAQKAEMSTAAYEDFVWDAVNKDWDEQRAFQAKLVDRLQGADEVRIVSGDATDLTLSVAGNPAINDFGEHNLPGGEVFTAPVPASVEGEVLFDKPVMIQGREVLDVRLVFENGEVAAHSAEKNEDVLTSLLETDDGARRLGELGIGMNRDIDRFTYNMLFDEKMGDTIHLAIGMAFEESVGDDNERNESAVHTDMIVDMSEESRIEVDGEVVQRDGTFVFEDGFGE